MSVCPICNKRVKRRNRTKEKGIWIHKRCPEDETGDFVESLFDFFSDPEGLTKEEIREELLQNGIDVDLLQERIEEIVTKGLMKRRRIACQEKKT